MHSLSSGKEFINGSNGVFGEFIDPSVTNNTNDTRSNNVSIMHYYFNNNLIQVFHNRSIKSMNNNLNLNESSDLILEISLDDLERLTPVQQVKQVLTCSYENNPVLIIVAATTLPSEEQEEENSLFWVDILSKTIKPVSLDKPLVGTITSSNVMRTPMTVPAGTTKELKDTNVLRHILALGMRDGSIQMIMLEYPTEKDVLKACSAIIEASELDGSPVTAVELYPPNSHQPTTLKRTAVCHDARLIVGTISGLLAYYAVQSTANIDVRNQYRLKRYINYKKGAITRIKALRDLKKDTKCIMAVAQDSSRDIGRVLTNDFNKQACVNIIELYASVGYSIMIVFRAINGSASETVCHTILSSNKGRLDLSKMSLGSDWILDAYPINESYLALKQKELIKTQNNTIESLPSSKEQSLSIKTSEEIIDITTKITINKTVALPKDNLKEYSREISVGNDSQTTMEYDSASTNKNDQEDKSHKIQEISQATKDNIDAAAENYSEAKTALDTLSHEIQEDPSMEVYPEENIALETSFQDIEKEEYEDMIDAKENYDGILPSNEAKTSDFKETEIVYDKTKQVILDKTVESSSVYRKESGEDDVQNTSETAIYPDHNTGSIINKLIASDTSVSSEDETYPSTAEKSKEASPDTSESDEPKNTRVPQVIMEENDEKEEQVPLIGQNSNGIKEDGEIIEEEEEHQQQHGFDGLESSTVGFDGLVSTLSQKVPSPFSFNSTFPTNDSNTTLVHEQQSSHYSNNHLYYQQYQHQNQNQDYAVSDSPVTVPTLTNTPDNNNSNNNWSSFVDTETTSTSIASPSPSMLKANDDANSPSPLQICNNDMDVNPPSPYEYIPMSPVEDSQLQDSGEEYTNTYVSSSTSTLPTVEMKTTIIGKTPKWLSQKQSLNREMAVNQELFIDVMLQELYPNYDKNYPVLNGELELILARPVNNNKLHSHAKYYKRLRDTGDGIVNSSIINISEADQNLVIVCWLLDRCEYKRALMYLQKNCNTAPYSYKIIKTLEIGFGVEKTHEYINELEATKPEDVVLFDPKAYVQVLQEKSFFSALAYINTNEKITGVRNDLMKFICDKLFQGPIAPSVHDIRELGIYNYADEQRQWVLTFAKNNESIASKTLLIYLYLIKEEKGEGVLLNRELQKNKPKAGLSVEEQALYQRCQELEDKVYDLEPTLSRDLPPEIYLFTPGQARPPYQNFFKEYDPDASQSLLGSIFVKRLEEANKRKRGEEDHHLVKNHTKYRKL
ncbi:hypothetical protein INT45_000493 [Circinella minor]|uniref:Uncharacterized protein n=1 Tax=Circinella minor TaxID=1195481 RepID=A0A8H7VNF4_9FUNG|nr:hypothetical protein INT45_000493 [Circinella minor]